MKTRIKERRTELGMSQEELSRKTGVSHTIISALENNQYSNITTRTMKLLSEALQMPISELFLL